MEILDAPSADCLMFTYKEGLLSAIARAPMLWRDGAVAGGRR
jgi:hypothetical protein